MSLECEKCEEIHDGGFGSGRFCSKTCANSRTWSIADKLKKSISTKKSLKVLLENTNRKKPIKLKKCPICRDEFSVFLNYKKQKIYCSRKCYNEDSEHKFRKVASGGYRQGSGRSHGGYYKGQWCASTYELVFLIYNLDMDNDIKKCTEWFEYGDGKKYYPDFVLDNTIIEIKGYTTDIVKQKLAAVRQLGIKIIILYKNDLKKEFDYVKEKYKTSNYRTLYDDYKPHFNTICD